MAKSHSTTTDTAVRDAKSGRTVIVRGVGALKGQLKLEKSVDLTKPIAQQAVRSVKALKPSAASQKH